MTKVEDIALSLDKFEDLGGKYFEQLVAIALDELGYVEGKTYVGAWSETCVPGTWIEADFIISKKNDKSEKPVVNGRIVLAIGHATSEDSARMKFHRDVEQLMEVKALPNGGEYRVIDILFCCPRETMGGWSKPLVAINEAIFDNSLIVWKHDWGMRLLQQIQLHGHKLTQGDTAAKKRKLDVLLSKYPAFRRQFDCFRAHLGGMLDDKASHSKITDIFVAERKQLPVRLAMPLLINQPEKTDFKRGLLQVLSLNPWEIDLLYRNHTNNQGGNVVPLERIASENGMNGEDFDRWWERLKLLSVKLGTCSVDFIDDEMLDPNAKEWRMFKASAELAYVLERFSVEELSRIRADLPTFAPNLVPYVKDLNDLDRYCAWREELKAHVMDEPSQFHTFASMSPDPANDYVRLAYIEIGMTIINITEPSFSYDKLAKATGLASLVRQSDHARFYAAGQRATADINAKALSAALQRKLREIPDEQWRSTRGVECFVQRRLDGMIKQHRGGVLDALLGTIVHNFAKRVGGDVLPGTNHMYQSPFNCFARNIECGVNVEVPYVVTLKDGRRILVHRVSASEGNAGHKWKEFSSKIRSMRYESIGDGRFRPVRSVHSTVLIVDGNWTRDAIDDPCALIRALQVAGWDYVVYPHRLAEAFTLIEAQLQRLPTLKKIAASPDRRIPIPQIEDLPMAAQPTKVSKLTHKGGHG